MSSFRKFSQDAAASTDAPLSDLPCPPPPPPPPNPIVVFFTTLCNLCFSRLASSHCSAENALVGDEVVAAVTFSLDDAGGEVRESWPGKVGEVAMMDGRGFEFEEWGWVFWIPSSPAATGSIVSVRTAMRVQRRYRVYCEMSR